jgi:hypothetical protein
MKLYPFTRNTVISLAVSVLTFLFFYYWEFPFHALTNIILKSGLMSAFYLYVNYKLAISAEINQVIDKFLPKF